MKDAAHHLQLVFSISVCLAVQATTARTRYVSVNGFNEKNCGVNSSDPCKTIQYALIDIHSVHSCKLIVISDVGRPFVISKPITLQVNTVSLEGFGTNTTIQSETTVPIFNTAQESTNISLIIRNIHIRRSSSLLKITPSDNVKHTVVELHGVNISQSRDTLLVMNMTNGSISLKMFNCMMYRSNFPDTGISLSGKEKVRFNVSLVNCTFRDNTASQHLFALHAKYGCVVNFRMSRTLIFRNHLLGPSGSGTFLIEVGKVNSLRIVLFQSRFSDNNALDNKYRYEVENRRSAVPVATEHGGGVLIRCMDDNKVKLDIISSLFVNNWVRKSGGGVAVSIGKRNNMTVQILSSVFTRNIAEFGGGFYMDGGIKSWQTAKSKNRIAFDIISSVFTKNIGTNKGGGVVLFGNSWSDVSFNIYKSEFDENKVLRKQGTGGGIYVFPISYNNVIFTIKSSKFSNNTVSKYGGAIYIRPFVGNNLTVRIQSVRFRSNKAKVAAAVNMIIRNDNNIVDLMINNSAFIENEASGFGGGTYTYARGAKNIIRTTISGSIYIRNFAGEDGGAIYYTNSLPQKYIGTLVQNSSFVSNKAKRKGGAISLAFRFGDIRTVIESSYFGKNGARFGGAISCAAGNLDIMNDNFYLNFGNVGGTLYLYGSLNTSLRDSALRSDKTTMIQSTSYIGITNTTLKMADVTLTTKSKRQIQVFKHKGVSIKISSGFKVSCPPSYTVVVKSKISPVSSMGDQLARVSISCDPCVGGYRLTDATFIWSNEHRNDKEHIDGETCLSCPNGGLCGPAHMVNLPNFWGYRDGWVIRFQNCQPGYCSTHPSSYNACAPNREGLLCTQCRKGFSLTLFSNQCVPNNECAHHVAYLLCGIILPVIILLLVVYGTCSMSSSSHKYCRDMATAGPSSAKEQHSEGVSFFVVFYMVTIFYQLQIFTKVPTKNGQELFGYLQILMATLSQMSIFDLNTKNFHFIPPFCPHKEFKYLHKKSYTLFLWIVLFTLFPCLRAIMRTVKKRVCTTLSVHTDGRNTAAVVVRLLLISFIPVSATLLELVKCVRVKDSEGKHALVLFSQADIVCTTWWQWLLWVILFVWFIPFAIVFHVSRRILPDESEDTQTNDEIKNCRDEHSRIKQRLLNVTKTLKWIQTPYKNTMGLTCDLIKNLMLVIIYTLTDYVLLRLYLMGFVILMFLIYVLCMDTYHERTLNVLQVSLTILLLCLDVMAMFDTLNIYNTPFRGSKREELHDSFDILGTIMMVLPILSIVYFGICRRTQNRGQP